MNPLAFKILNTNNPNETANNGAQSSNLFEMLFCSICNISASMSRAERIAVSPDVIGAAMTPSIASIPPRAPSQFLHKKSTTCAAVKLLPCSWKNAVAAAAHIKATMPSTTIAP